MTSTSSLASSKATADEPLTKTKKGGKGSTLAGDGMDQSCMIAYATIAKRWHCERNSGIKRYPYEAGFAVGAFIGGVFEHK